MPDDVVQLHIDDIEHFAAFALAHANHSVTRFELAVLLGRATGNQLVDNRVAIDRFELAPMPCRCVLIRMSKFSDASGTMYVLCGSKLDVIDVKYISNSSLLSVWCIRFTRL